MVTTRAFLPFRNDDAAIVGISANIVTLPTSSTYSMGASAYCCSKFAQAKLLEYVSAEHPDMFVVSAHPGCVETDMLRASRMNLEPAMMDDGTFSIYLFIYFFLSFF